MVVATGVDHEDGSMPGKCLTLQERAQIEVLFGHGLRFEQIARLIGRDRTTVWREVTRNRTNGRSGQGRKHPYGCQPGYLPGRGYPPGWGRAYGWRYSHVAAQGHADRRARRPRSGKLRPRWVRRCRRCGRLSSRSLPCGGHRCRSPDGCGGSFPISRSFGCLTKRCRRRLSTHHRGRPG